MTEIIMQYWPKDRPPPEGWMVTNEMRCNHHGHYSVLIRKLDAAPSGLYNNHTNAADQGAVAAVNHYHDGEKYERITS